jgi:hypothetical protein
MNIHKDYLMSKEMKLFLYDEGEWIDEPDYMEWEYGDGEIKCIAKRNDFGAWCGYIEISKDHPWANLEGTDFPCEVHGGITFHSNTGINTVRIGFDCSHSTDISPTCEITLRQVRESLKVKHPWIPDTCTVFPVSYKNVGFIIHECNSLAKQALEATRQEANE